MTPVHGVRGRPAERNGAPGPDRHGAGRYQLLLGRTVILLAASVLLAVLAALVGPGALRLAFTLGVAGLLVHVNRLQATSTRRRLGLRPPSSTRHPEEP